MKKNKGFTLVELLGVIILLGVIAVIITPNILKLEKKSEKELFEDSVNALIRGAQMYYANNDFINYPTNGIAANSEELNVKNNEDLTSGSIKLVNDEYFYQIIFQMVNIVLMVLEMIYLLMKENVLKHQLDVLNLINLQALLQNFIKIK